MRRTCGSRARFCFFGGRRSSAWRSSIEAARRIAGIPERRLEAEEGNQTNDDDAGDGDQSTNAARPSPDESPFAADRYESADGSRRSLIIGARLAARGFRRRQWAEFLHDNKGLLGRGIRIVVSDGRGAGVIRSGDEFDASLFLLMTLEPFNQPIVDRNFSACDRRTIVARALMAFRSCTLLLLPAPEGLGDPIIA